MEGCCSSQEPALESDSPLCLDQPGQLASWAQPGQLASRAQRPYLSRRSADAFLVGDQMRVIEMELCTQEHVKQI